ncbi:MAG: CoA transferase [Chloroflexota bacterium]
MSARDPLAVAAEVWAALGGDAADLRHLRIEGHDPVYPSPFAVGTVAAASVGVATLAAARLAAARDGSWPEATVEMRHAAAAFRSERYLRINGAPAAELWSPLSGYYRVRDGHWVQLHTNFPHHRDRAAAVLGVAAERAAFETALARLDRFEVEQRFAEAGACAFALRSPEEWAAHPQSRALASLPLLSIERIDDGAPARPLPHRASGDGALDGVRVLDLTRVLAGPVAGRTFAAHGADVVRVGAAHLPVMEAAVLDTGFGKRFAHIDLRAEDGRDRLRELVAGTDVFMQAYRPGALASRGFGFEEVARRRPGIVYVSLCAWSEAGPWAERRGFDSLVQTASGIAFEGGAWTGHPGEPGPLPAQALDHATGYLAAAAAMTALARRAREGGSYHVRLSLAQTGRWLADMPRLEARGVPDPTRDDIADLLDELPGDRGTFSFVRPPGRLSSMPVRWTAAPQPPTEAPIGWQDP